MYHQNFSKNKKARRIRRASRCRKNRQDGVHWICIYRSNRHIYVQLLSPDRDKTLESVSSKNLGLSYGGNKESAERVGKEFGTRVSQSFGNVPLAFDRSGYQYHGRVAAVATVLRTMGLKF